MNLFSIVWVPKTKFQQQIIYKSMNAIFILFSPIYCFSYQHSLIAVFWKVDYVMGKKIIFQ